MTLDHLLGYFDIYDRILVFDTETTGLDFKADEIIQFSSVLLQRQEGKITMQTYNELLALAPGKKVPPQITALTGITDEALRTRGIPRDRACREIAELMAGNTLLCAYNAQFDLCFLFYMMAANGCAEALKDKDKLDLLTVYRDRRSYPHKLASAIEGYSLGDEVTNSHSADDDALAAAYVMSAMTAENPDLMCYVNLFGYIPKYGPPKPQIRSIRYAPQYYDPKAPLYVE